MSGASAKPAAAPLAGIAPPVGPVPPFQEAVAIKLVIDSDTSGKVDIVPNAIRTLAGEKRTAFLKWYLEMAALQSEFENQEDALSKPSDTITFRDALDATDWGDRSSIDRLFAGTLGAGIRAASEPIYVGKDNRWRYYLVTEQPMLTLKRNTPNDKPAHPYLVELRNFDGTPPPFQYAFPLGSLAYYYDDPDISEPGKLHSTPFYLYLDVLQRNIWLVLGSEFQDELGEDVSIPIQANAWKYLPSPQNDRTNFKAVLLQSLRQLGKLDENKSFFEALQMNKVSEMDVLVYAASLASVEDGLKRRPAAGG